MRMASRLKTTPKQAISNRIVDKQDAKAKSTFIWNRALAFCIDTSVMLAPIALTNLLIIMIFGALLPPMLLSISIIVGGVLVLGSMLITNSYFYTKSVGQSVGKKVYGFKVVNNNLSKASTTTLVLRELIGYVLPLIVGMMVANLVGVFAYWAINGICFLVSKSNRCLIDYLLRTRVIAITNTHVSQSVSVKKIEHIGIDLHIHSNFSANGQFNVEEIFQRAKQGGIQTISITDLDCVKHNLVAQQMSKLYHINYIPGIEINASVDGRRVRILGYFIDYSNELFTHIENDSLLHEKQASVKRVTRFEELIGRHIPLEPLLAKNRFQKIPGEMIARFVLEHEEYDDIELLQPYIRGAKKEHPYREIAKDFFAYGKTCYVEVKYPSLTDILEVITLANGIAVLAHPGKFMAHHPDLFNKVIDAGVQGLEVFHPKHSKAEMARLLQVAKEHKLLISAGSGFFNDYNDIVLGETHAPQEAKRLVSMLLNKEVYQTD